MYKYLNSHKCLQGVIIKYSNGKYSNKILKSHAKYYDCDVFTKYVEFVFCNDCSFQHLKEYIQAKSC